MTNITLWALESDNDRDVVAILAKKIVLFNNTEDKIFIRRAGKSSIPKKRIQDPLITAVKNYLKEDEFVIFVIDSDGPISSNQRRQETNSLINQVERVINDELLAKRVFLVFAKQEVEAWLLVDCLGIFHFYAQAASLYRSKSRDILQERFYNIIKKYQKGKTELIVEAEMGGAGPKEYLVDFSEDILRALNPNLSIKDVKNKRYSENMSPKIAEFILIDRDTLSRNKSLTEFKEILLGCIL